MITENLVIVCVVEMIDIFTLKNQQTSSWHKYPGVLTNDFMESSDCKSKQTTVV